MKLAVLSVNVAEPSVLLPWPTGDIISGIDKRPVSSATLWLDWLNLAGDGQADTRPTPDGGQVHGGPDKAIYAYPAAHFPLWAAELECPVGPGLFGENLTIGGATEADVNIGDVWAWGDALLQVSMPRLPCYKLGIRLGKQALRRRVRETGRVGWYLRVLRPGNVPTSGGIEVVERDPHGITVARIHTALQQPRAADRALLDLAPLAAQARWLLRLPQRDHSGGVPESD